MLALKKWNNGALGRDVKKIIEGNFDILERHLNSTVLTLSTSERELLSDIYKSEGLRVYDKTLDKWYKYTNGSWVSCSEFTIEINTSDWIENIISIPFSVHHIKNPVVQVYIRVSNTYSLIMESVTVDANHNIQLFTDLPFAGKVVIK